MPTPTKVDQGTIVILDVGQNVAEPEEKGQKSFFEQARECTARLIERKIMSQGKNLLGVVLMGAKTKNNMADQCAGAFRRIELLNELQTPSWNMIRELPEKAFTGKSDWVEAIVVAADHFKHGVYDVKIAHKKIVLMTNFQRPTKLGSEDIEQVLNGLNEDNLEVDVIGPELIDQYDGNQKGDDFEIAKQFVDATNGATAPFAETMEYLLFHKKKITNPSAWNVDLSIGPNMKIPVSSYIRLKDEPIVKKWLKSVKDPVTLKASTSEGVVRDKVHINTENQSVIEPEEIIKGYNYGQKIIPFNDCDKAMLYESGERCLSVYGFTSASNVTWQNLTGDGLSYIFGRKGDTKAQKAVQCLVECLHELNLVGLVRRVYNKGNAPKMFALMPVIDTNNYVCLSMAAVCFKEDIKSMAFPTTNLKKYNVTNEQVNAFKDLIKSMDLTKAYDESFEDAEAFPITETVSPSAQYILDCIAFRAMNPGKPLPQPRDEIMHLFKKPPTIEKNSRQPLEKIKNLFTLKEVEVKTKSRRRDNNQINNNDPIKSEDKPTDSENGQGNPNSDIPTIILPKKTNVIDRIGTIDPVNDFKYLIEDGKTLADLSPELAEVVENLVYCNLDGKYIKAMNTMEFFRAECVKGHPAIYNNWLHKFKKELLERKTDEVLALITEKNLNFILKEENSLSTYDADTHEDSQLYDNDTIPNSTQLSIRPEVDDMYDDM